jgi:hypothetical protein
VVHVLTTIVEKVHTALRPGGLLLITMPASSMTGLTVLIDQAVLLQTELIEPNFGQVLQAVHQALTVTTTNRLFMPLTTMIVPTEVDRYLHDDWEDVESWFTHTSKLSIDPEPLRAVTAQIRQVVVGRTHRLRESYKEEQLLFQKQGE